MEHWAIDRFEKSRQTTIEYRGGERWEVALSVVLFLTRGNMTMTEESVHVTRLIILINYSSRSRRHHLLPLLYPHFKASIDILRTANMKFSFITMVADLTVSTIASPFNRPVEASTSELARSFEKSTLVLNNCPRMY